MERNSLPSVSLSYSATSIPTLSLLLEGQDALATKDLWRMSISWWRESLAQCYLSEVLRLGLGCDFFSSQTDTQIRRRRVRRFFCSRLFFCVFVSADFVFFGYFSPVNITKWPQNLSAYPEKFICAQLRPSTWKIYLRADLFPDKLLCRRGTYFLDLCVDVEHIFLTGVLAKFQMGNGKNTGYYLYAQHEQRADTRDAISADSKQQEPIL